MDMTELELLYKAIKKFKNKEYDEGQFQSSFNSVINMIIESHYYQMRLMFESIDYELERILFMSNNTREDYLIEINKIENILKDNNLFDPMK